MGFRWRGSIWELMVVQRPSGTHLSQSSTSGGRSPLARDNDNTLVAQAVLFAGSKAALGLVGAGVMLGLIASPHVRSGWLGLKSKLDSWAEEIADADIPIPLPVVEQVESEQAEALQPCTV